MKSSAIVRVMALIILATGAQADHWAAAPPFDQDLASFCDLHDKAAMSQPCFGFVSAVVEITLIEDLQRVPNAQRRICMPSPHLSIENIFDRIRPYLRKRFCAGLCTASSDVQGGLYAAFPCKQ